MPLRLALQPPQAPSVDRNDYSGVYLLEGRANLHTHAMGQLDMLELEAALDRLELWSPSKSVQYPDTAQHWLNYLDKVRRPKRSTGVTDTLTSSRCS